MSAFFTSTIEAALAGQTVRKQLLARFDFASGTKRVCEGFGQLVAGGVTWQGMGVFGSVEGLSMPAGTAAVPLVFKLSGVDESVVAAARNAEAEVKGRLCFVYLQFFDEAWAPLDNPATIAMAVMDTCVFDAGGPSRNVTLTAERLFAARKAAPYARYTDRDQQARFPGDRFCEHTPTLTDTSFIWPRFSS